MHTVNLGIRLWTTASAILTLLHVEDAMLHVWICVIRYSCSWDFFYPSKDLWAPPPRTPAKDRLNVRLAKAHEDFMVWTRERKIQHLSC